jgi:hypothetical protein
VSKSVISLAALGMVVAMASPALAATSAPPTPIDLFNGYQACSTDSSSPVYLNTGDVFVDGSQDLVLEALSQDTTDTSVTENFQVWPISEPSQSTTFTQSGVSSYEISQDVPGSDLTNGQTYAWEADASGSGGTSAWSSPCYFTVENTGPANPPTVTSANYPSGQADQGGAPIQLTFGANGDSDVAGYEFSWSGDLPVPGGANIGSYGIPHPADPYTSDPQNFAQASTLGGSATVGLVPPQDTGLLVLTVASLDQAFNQSSTTTYEISVKPDAPTIDLLTPNPKFGQKAHFKLLPGAGIQAASPVTSYTVQLESTGQTISVPANAHGTAKFSVTLDDPSGTNAMVVTSKSADGWTSENSFWSSQINTTPVVTSNIYLANGSGGGPGVPDTFTFTLKVKGIASFTYSFSDGTTGTVKAKRNGTAQVNWTPQSSGLYFLQVYATLKNGTNLEPYFNSFTVN